MEHENETAKNPGNLFACVSHFCDSFRHPDAVFVDDREISSKKAGPDKGQNMMRIATFGKLNNLTPNLMDSPMKRTCRKVPM